MHSAFVVMALEHYDSFFSAYPEKLAEQTARCIENARAAFAVAAEKGAAQVQRVLSEKVAEVSQQIVRRLADKPVRFHHFRTALAVVMAFGALCGPLLPRRPHRSADRGGPLARKFRISLPLSTSASAVLRSRDRAAQAFVPARPSICSLSAVLACSRPLFSRPASNPQQAVPATKRYMKKPYTQAG
jgi:hypothetical protein